MSIRRVVAEVSLRAIVNNMDTMHKRLSKGTKLMAVIKSNGYGHGSLKLAKLFENIDYIYGYATATAEEALELRQNGITKEILILGYTFPENYEDLIKNNICPVVFKEETAKQINDVAVKLNKHCKIHIAVDTGMSRIGVSCDDTGIETVKKIVSYSNIDAEGIFTHFARSDEEDLSDAYNQFSKFTVFLDSLKKENITFNINHCSNSAAIFKMPDANLDMVRAGITIYGLWPAGYPIDDTVHLEPALSLKSSIVYIKTLKKDTPISYGGTYVTTKDTKVATIPVGYADGYPRTLSNKGYVLIRGQKAPIIGRICMDQFMVDVTDIDGVSEYDEVVLIGNSGGLSITAEELGDLSSRFNYELVCDITDRVPRKYVDDFDF